MLGATLYRSFIFYGLVTVPEKAIILVTWEHLFGIE